MRVYHYIVYVVYVVYVVVQRTRLATPTTTMKPIRPKNSHAYKNIVLHTVTIYTIHIIYHAKTKAAG